MKRHDYLPFGEELGAGVGIRTAGQGYPPPDDKVRQKFTGYERDGETGLDYAQARMYANVQGRFTSPDPLYIAKHRLIDPQQLNIYAYVRNNPLVYIDPHGLDIYIWGDDVDNFVKILNARENEGQKASFQVAAGNDGKLGIVDKDGKALSSEDLQALGKGLTGGEATLFNAITNSDFSGIVDTQAEASYISIGLSQDALLDTKGRGVNMIDMKDLGAFAAEDKGAAGSIAAHEALESYISASLNANFQTSHSQASKAFPELVQVPGPQFPVEKINGRDVGTGRVALGSKVFDMSISPTGIGSKTRIGFDVERVKRIK
jgi:RHS repeat-associated protein